MHEDKPANIAFLLCPLFSSVGFACALEVLRAANKLSGRNLYDWQVLSSTGGLVTANSGIDTMTKSAFENPGKFHSIVVVAGHDPARASNTAIRNWLRAQARHGRQIGGISTGAWVMAESGLMDGHRSAIHWENAASFIEAFPSLEVSRSVFEIDRDRFTCAGGTSAMDMMLHIVAREHSHGLATEIARYYQHERIRSAGDLQTESRDAVIRIKSVKLMRAIKLMEENLDQPVNANELAKHAEITPRQLQRLFKEHTGLSPNRFYLDLRLRHARLLLLQTAMSVIDVAVAAGFVSHAHFTKCYRNKFDVTPTEERRRAF